MHRPMTLKQKLDEEPYLLGGFVFSTDPNISQIYAEAGFHFVVVDTEHALNDLQSVSGHIRACAAGGIHCIVRLGAGNFADAARLLDAGAEGMMLPHVGLPGSGTDEVLRSLRYAPEGTRGTCTGVRVAGYGLSDFAASASASNRAVLSIGLVEDMACVQSIDQVLERTAVDWIMPGPGDLATSLGVHGQLQHPDVNTAVETVISAATRRKVPVGMYINHPSEVARWHSKGVRFFIHSIDYKILANALKGTTETLRHLLAEEPRSG